MQSYIERYNYALSLFNAGHSEKAKNILLNLLEQNPNDFNYYFFLGVIELRKKNFEDSVTYLEKCVELNPKHKDAFFNLGICYENLGQTAEAISSYNRVLNIAPDDIDALNNLGMLCARNELLDEAQKYFLRCIQILPNSETYYNNIANLYQNISKFDEALKSYVYAYEIEPTNYEVYYNLSNCYERIGFSLQAIPSMKTALSLCPGYLSALNNLGPIYKFFLDFKNAELCYRFALKSFSEGNDKNNQKLLNLISSDIQSEIKNFDIEKVDKLLFSEFDFFYSLHKSFKNNKTIFTGSGPEDAKNILSMLLSNLGTALFEQGFIQRSIDYFEASLKLVNTRAEVHHNLSFSYLMLGNFKKGWEEHEWRKKRSDVITRKFKKPLPENKAQLFGKTVLISDEQGMGDSIQFCRYLQKLKEYNCKIIYECWSNLIDLYKSGLSGYDELILKDEKNPADIKYDFGAPLLDLSPYLEDDFNNIYSPIPYIRATDEYIEKWKKVINENVKLKVGLVWAGNPHHKRDKLRSLPLEYLKIFENINGVIFYIIQKDCDEKILADFNFEYINLNNYDFKSYEDTAGIIENLDLVISVDTSTIHLAGAMGKPVWTLISYVPDFRWLFDGIDTKWYPTMKLYRQTAINNWDEIIKKLRDDLIDEVFKKTKINNDKNINITIRKENNHFNNGIGIFRNGLGYLDIYNLVKNLNLNSCLDFSEAKQELIYNSKYKRAFIGLLDTNFTELFSIKAENKIGYFTSIYAFENIPDKVLDEYSQILTSSEYLKQKIINSGFKQVEVINDFYDDNTFKLERKEKQDKLFVIFSDGWINLLSGIDIIIELLKVIQKKYNDVVFINSYKIYSQYDLFLLTQQKGLKIDFDIKDEKEVLNNLFKNAGLDLTKIISLGNIPYQTKNEILKKCNIGLYPMRFSNGYFRNILETYATGLPVVMSYNSALKEIINDNIGYPVKNNKDYHFKNSNNKIRAFWFEPDFEETLSQIEKAYLNRERNLELGFNAANFVKNFTFSKNIEKLSGIFKNNE